MKTVSEISEKLPKNQTTGQRKGITPIPAFEQGLGLDRVISTDLLDPLSL